MKYLKKKIAQAVDSRKYDWLWDAISNTYFGYYLRKTLLWIMGVSEDAAIRDVVSKRSDFVLKSTHSPDAKSGLSVLLIAVPLPANRKNKRILPLGLASLAAFVREKLPEVNIGILDAQCLNMNYEDIVSKVKEHKWDVVGISYWTVQANLAAKISKGIKVNAKDTIIIHGGVHPTLCPEESLKSADYVVSHEGEITLVEFLKALKGKKDIKKVDGISYLENGKVKFTNVRPIIGDLNDLPRPAYDLLPIERYKMPLHVVGGERLPIMGSRGCPYNCSFCNSPNLWQGKVRWVNPKKLVDDVEWLMKNYHVSKFHFWDDNFTLNPSFVRGFCGEIEKRKLNIQWVALDRAEHINKNKNLLPMMKKSGCVGIEIGLESANPETFPHISKEQGIDDSKNAINNLKNNGIFPLYTCMAFNPGESIVGYYMQKEFLDMAQKGFSWHKFFHPFAYPVYIGQFATPYPKTKFWENLEKDSMILVEKPEDRFHHQINSVPYSLLHDKPIATTRNITEDLYMIFLNGSKLNLWAYFSGNDSKTELGNKLYEFWKFVKPFFQKCKGESSLKEIGAELSRELGISEIKAMRLTAFATYIFAQVGAIRSVDQYTDYAIDRKVIEVPLSIRLDIKSLLKPLGVKEYSFEIS